MKTFWAVLRLTLLSIVVDVAIRNFPGVMSISRVSLSLYLQGFLLSAMWWWFWLSVASRIQRRGLKIGLFALVCGYWSVIVVSDFVHLKHLGQHITAFSMRIVWSDPAYFVGYWNSFGGAWAILPFTILFASSIYLMSARDAATKRAHVGLVLPLIVTGIEVGHLTRNGGEGALSVEASIILSHVNAIKMSFGTGPRLHAGNRMEVKAFPDADSPDAVVFFVTESLGIHHSRWDGSGPAALPELQGWFQERVAFLSTESFANASATDMSMPSLLTGLTPDAGSDLFHTLPFIWDYFHASGYKTAWFSSQRFSWAGFSSFFNTKGLETIESSESMGGVLVNDTGQDDLLTVKRIEEWIESAEKGQKIFLIVNLNAAHIPCQSRSDFLELPEEGEPCDQAMRILDHGFMRVIEAIEERSSENLFVFTSDHGELTGNGRAIPRVQSYYDEILRIPFAIVLPEGFRSHHQVQVESLRENLASRQIMNADLAPTLADLLELGRVGENREWLVHHSGHSLLAELPENRWIMAMNTGSIRTWSREGFALIRGDTRFLFFQGQLPLLYDVGDDPEQQVSVWDENQSVASEIYALIESSRSLKRIVEGQENVPFSSLEK